MATVDDRLLLYREVSAREPPKPIEVSVYKVKTDGAGAERPRVLVALVSNVIGLDSMTSFYPEFTGGAGKSEHVEQQSSSTVDQQQPTSTTRSSRANAGPSAASSATSKAKRKIEAPFKINVPTQPHQSQSKQQHKLTASSAQAPDNSPGALDFDDFRFTPTDSSPIVDLSISPPRRKSRREQPRLAASPPGSGTVKRVSPPSFPVSSEFATMREKATESHMDRVPVSRIPKASPTAGPLLAQKKIGSTSRNASDKPIVSLQPAIKSGSCRFGCTIELVTRSMRLVGPGSLVPNRAACNAPRV